MKFIAQHNISVTLFISYFAQLSRMMTKFILGICGGMSVADIIYHLPHPDLSITTDQQSASPLSSSVPVINTSVSFHMSQIPHGYFVFLGKYEIHLDILSSWANSRFISRLEHHLNKSGTLESALSDPSLE